MPDIITAGEILVEVMTRKVGQEFLEPGELTGPYPSGAPAIFIDQAARMGASCGIIARVGDDDFGLLNLRRLENDVVDISKILKTPGYTTGTAFVTYFSDGSRKFIFHFIHSAAGKLSPEDVDEDYIKQAKLLHIMGCSLSTTESMRKAILKAVAIARENGVWVSFDPNIRLELMDDENVKCAFQSILSSTDILLTGNSEALAVTGAAAVEEAVGKLKDRGIKMIVVKNGSKGARAYTRKGYTDAPLFKVAEVDPTGAGDCFDGAFVAGMAEGKSIEEALTLASAAGALGVTKKGPMEGAAFRRDIMELVERKNN